ncbi:hypothetical protein F4Z99_04805 [Candidatus Poribacteria bacterium]|nr:hypothetical protein [Candidatus Poribacteria bacterium]MYA99550.1 hypothetical protein [Candidatus Poribacteria bacterium]
MEIPSIRIIGDESQTGTYILRIRLKEDTTLQFGRFKKGKWFSLLAGDIPTSVPHCQRRARLHWRGGSFDMQRGAVINRHMLSEKKW